MKKIITLLLLFSLCLTGCQGGEATTPHAYEDLSIVLPPEYIDLSGEDFAQGLAFVFGRDPIAVNGLREEKATFQAYGLEIDLQRYGDLLMKSNKVSGTMKQKDGIWTFSYESNGFTYVVTVWETEDAFWTVQAYCPTENYSKAKKEMWQILSSVTI